MKLLPCLVLCFSSFHASGQQIDSLFGIDGIVSVSQSCTGLIEQDENIFLHNVSSITSLNSDGSINVNFGEDGHVDLPFGNETDFITHTFIHDNSYHLLGCTRGATEVGVDIHKRELDLEDGSFMVDKDFVEHREGDQEFTSFIAIDDSVLFFGYDAGVVFHNSFRGSMSNDKTEIEFLSLNQSDDFFPYAPVPISIKKIAEEKYLVVYERIPTGEYFFQIVDDLKGIDEFNLNAMHYLSSSIITYSDFVDLNWGNFLAMQHSNRFNEETITNVISVNKLDGTSSVVDLPFIDSTFEMLELREFDQESFLVVGKEWTDGDFKTVIYSINKDLSLNLDFGLSGKFTLPEGIKETSSKSTFVTEKAIYVLSDSKLLRVSKQIEMPEEEVGASMVVSFRPNPVASTVFVTGLAEGLVHSYTIYSLDGIKVKSGAVHKNEIDVHDVTAGVYALTISIDGEILTRKIIVR